MCCREALTAAFMLGQRALLVVSELLVRRRHKAAKPILLTIRGPMGIGRRKLSLILPAAYRRELQGRRHLSLVVGVGFLGASGQRLVFTRDVAQTR
jgi:hypothetical protein